MHTLPDHEFVLQRFAELDHALLELLESLSPEDWQKPTLAKAWKVKAVASHLLDGNLRNLSMGRDGYFDPHIQAPVEGVYRARVDFLNDLNASWVSALYRLSPQVLIELLRSSGQAYTAYLHSIDPESPALFAVDWAGEAHTTSRMHIAREFTEKWHHQQQIREALGREEDLLTLKWYQPFLQICFQALPFHYRELEADEGTVLAIAVEEVLERYLIRGKEGWELGESYEGELSNRVWIPRPIAWRVFTKGISYEDAKAAVRVSGEEALGLHVLRMLTVMA